MAVERIHLEGQRDLTVKLRALGGAKLRRAAQRAVTRGLKPMLAVAKRLVPVASGRLRASLGASVQIRRRKDGVIGRLGPRRDFRFTGKGRLKGQKLVSGQGRQRDRALAKGYRQDQGNPNRYARIIEMGVDKAGRIRRKAGPARFLLRALEGEKATAIAAVTAELRAAVTPA